jgi:hypothetical protein
MVRVLTSSIVSSNATISAFPLRNTQKKEPVGLRSGDLKGHSLMSFAVLSRNGEQDLCSMLQLLQNVQSICEEMNIVSYDLPKIFLRIVRHLIVDICGLLENIAYLQHVFRSLVRGTFFPYRPSYSSQNLAG